MSLIHNVKDFSEKCDVNARKYTLCSLLSDGTWDKEKIEGLTTIQTGTDNTFSPTLAVGQSNYYILVILGGPQYKVCASARQAQVGQNFIVSNQGLLVQIN